MALRCRASIYERPPQLRKPKSVSAAALFPDIVGAELPTSALLAYLAAYFGAELPTSALLALTDPLRASLRSHETGRQPCFY